MGGGLMQLVAYGAQDIYLTGNPQITFFKVVYRRHTNFSMEAIQQTLNGSISASESTVSSTISRNGDLVCRMWLDILLPDLAEAELAQLVLPEIDPPPVGYKTWTNNTGHAFVKSCEIEIGGQKIDKHSSEWLDVWNELTDKFESDWVGLNKHSVKGVGTISKTQLYVPLQFWFCRNPGLALPLIALQYHEVKININTRSLTSLVNTNKLLVPDRPLAFRAPEVKLWVDYIYLDTDERRRFAQVSHEYLIEQIQEVKDQMPVHDSITLNLNHPVKELIWISRTKLAGTSSSSVLTTDATANVPGGVIANNNDYFCYGTPGGSGTEEGIYGQASQEAFGTMKLKLNGHDRFAERRATYFRICQPKQADHKIPSKHIYCYSFALKPEEHQPSGTCNFSRIDNAVMSFTGGAGSASDLIVFAVNYNVLRIMSGMGGLAYSN